ncbi:MAG: hypothetical protein J5986_10875, partial [Roseburia sp.]|nr:hypothetical protein [Roseburia sp.]
MQKITFSGKAAAGAAATGILLLVLAGTSASQEVSIGQPYQSVRIDGQLVGYTSGNVDVKGIICAARRELASETDEKLCMDFDWNADTERKPFVGLLRETELKEAVKQSLKGKVISSGERVYTVAIDDYRGNFRSLEEVNTFLNKVKDKAEGGEAYTTELGADVSHISGVMQAQLVGTSATGTEEASEKISAEGETRFAGASAAAGDIMSATDGQQAGGLSAGVIAVTGMQLAAALAEEPEEETELSYRTGVLDMEFVEQVEIYENYVSAEDMDNIDEEVVEVTKEK